MGPEALCFGVVCPSVNICMLACWGRGIHQVTCRRFLVWNCCYYYNTRLMASFPWLLVRKTSALTEIETVEIFNWKSLLRRNILFSILILCIFKLKDRLPSKELRERLGVDDIALVFQQNRLRWYGHVLRKENDDWVKKCMEYEVEGPRPRRAVD